MAFSPLNDRLSESARHRENRGRLTHVYSRVKTEGYGTYEFEERIDFDLTFIERPFIAVGHQVDADQAQVEDEAGDVFLPQCTGYVTEWDTTSSDHYVGCWVAVSVEPSAFFTLPEGDGPVIFHDFVWSAIAIKDLPTAD